MSKGATEWAVVPLKSGQEVEDITSADGQLWQNLLATIADNEGHQRSYWGTQEENPSNLILAVDWDSVEDHIAFTKSAPYGLFLEQLGTLQDGDIDLHHVHFSPHPPSNAMAMKTVPASQCFILYLALDVDQKSYEENIQEFVKTLEERAKGFKGCTMGWVVEELEHENVEGKCKAYAGAIGWDSVQAHMAFKETQAYKDNVHLFDTGLKASEVYHVRFRER